MHIFAFKFDSEYHDDLSCNIGISKISRLTTLFAADVTWYDLVQKWSFCQWWCSHFKLSSRSCVPTLHNGIYRVSEMTHEVWYHEISRICGVRLVPKNRFHWREGSKWTFKKGRSYRVVVLIVSMSKYTILTPYENPSFDFNKEFRKPEPCEYWGGYHNARGHPKYGEFIIIKGYHWNWI